MASPKHASFSLADRLKPASPGHERLPGDCGQDPGEGGTPKNASAGEPISVAPESWTPWTSRFFLARQTPWAPV